MKAAHALAAALTLASGLAIAQSSQNADQDTSVNGAPAPQRMEQQADTGPTTGSRNLGDPATMNNNGDYLEACKQLGADARKDCMAQAKRDRMNIDRGDASSSRDMERGTR